MLDFRLIRTGGFFGMPKMFLEDLKHKSDEFRTKLFEFVRNLDANSKNDYDISDDFYYSIEYNNCRRQIGSDTFKHDFLNQIKDTEIKEFFLYLLKQAANTN